MTVPGLIHSWRRPSGLPRRDWSRRTARRGQDSTRVSSWQPEGRATSSWWAYLLADHKGGLMAKEKYDVVVVGSGAGGATAAYTLVNLGANVILLEAGRMLNPA